MTRRLSPRFLELSLVLLESASSTEVGVFAWEMARVFYVLQSGLYALTAV
jgi:hypothetical protein